MVKSNLARKWYASFRQSVRDPAIGFQLRSAADGAKLKPWTELLTDVVIRACHLEGWVCTARNAADHPLPVRRAELLAIDTMAFHAGDGWREPIAAFELENSRRSEYIEYALWKACMVRVPLSCLYCYRAEASLVSPLISLLEKKVLATTRPTEELLVVVGTRSSADLFPDGYFKPFFWNADSGKLLSLASAA